MKWVKKMKLQDIKEFNKYLPVGTVVLVNNNIKTLMIIGYLSKNENKISDYIAVYYPEGFHGKECLQKFNHDDIVGVLKLGLKFDKQEEYNEFLNNKIEEYKF